MTQKNWPDSYDSINGKKIILCSKLGILYWRFLLRFNCDITSLYMKIYQNCPVIRKAQTPYIIKNCFRYKFLIFYEKFLLRLI